MTHTTIQTLAQAVEAHYGELRQFVRRRTGSSSLAEEVAQEIWIRACSVTTPLPDNPRAYLYRMAGNLAVDQIRRQRVQLPVSDTDGDTAELDTALNQLPCPAPTPEEAAISQQELAQLARAVRELPEKCREVFLLYRGRGLSMKEIAEHLDISAKTVEKHIARAMVHCRQALRRAGRDV